MWSPAASAFCGTYVGSPGSQLGNRSSHVVVSRQGTVTRLTLAADLSGDLGGGTDTGDALDSGAAGDSAGPRGDGSFALILPVPEVLGPGDVSVVDLDLVQEVDRWDAPRAVAYTCDSLYTRLDDRGGCGLPPACNDYGLVEHSGPAGVPVEAGGVTVEAAFSEAEYDIVVLSGEDSAGLWRWLDANGYAVPDGGEELLQAYIDAGVYFLAAKVRADAVPEGTTWLRPLQLRYTAEMLGLPIRIGTLSATGTQEVVVHVFGGPETGEVAIANYPEAVVADECMWPEGAELGAWYDAQVQTAVDLAGGAAWVREYSWPLAKGCDPCPDGQVELSEAALDALVGSHHRLDQHLTRLRMRYEPDLVPQDLVFYETRQTDVTEQQRYIAYRQPLEHAFPLCEGQIEGEPGTCPDDPDDGADCGPHSAAGAWVWGAGWLTLVGLRRRRDPDPPRDPGEQKTGDG